MTQADPERLWFVVPGPLDQRTGGYLYDRRVVEGLRALGRRVDLPDLAGAFPTTDETAARALGAALATVPDDATVVIDGLAMGGLPGPVREHAGRLKVVSLVHHPLAEESGLSPEVAERFRTTEREALAACRGVVVTSPFTASCLAGYGVPADRIRTVRPGTARPDPEAGAETVANADAGPLLLCVASVTPRKAHEILIAALAGVRDLAWTCVCAGGLDWDPEHTRSVLGLRADEGLDDRVHFIGERTAEGLDALYRRAHAFVLPSRYEGYGMALTEAIAHGVPVISTTGGAIPYTVPADAGILVEPDDVRAFADALRTVLTDSAHHAALAEAACRHAESLPTWDDTIEGFAEAVRELSR